MEKAMKMAREASADKMRIHANFLGISDIDMDTQVARTDKEIRIDYRKKAAEDSKGFIDSFNDKTIETKYYIERALTDGTISNSINPNKVMWKAGNKEILDISGIRSREGMVERLVEFTQVDEKGEEFAIMLKAIYSK